MVLVQTQSPPACKPLAKRPSAAPGSPPAGVEEYTFTYSRSGRKMRFRLGDGEWLCSRFVGKWEVLGTDPSGAIRVRCKLRIDKGVAYVYVPKDVDMDAYSCDVPTGSHETHWRLCYFREETLWRLLDERTGVLTLVTDYRGVMNVNYFDGGTHIFHDGPVHIDEEKVAHFVPPR